MRVRPTKYVLKGGLYGGLNGWFHGDERGELPRRRNRVWDERVPHAPARAKVADQVIEVRDGDESATAME